MSLVTNSKKMIIGLELARNLGNVNSFFGNFRCNLQNLMTSPEYFRSKNQKLGV